MPKAAFRIEQRMGVPAPSLAVWEALADLEGWADWNPLYTRAEGVIRIGGALTLTEAAPGKAPVVLAATVVDWTPEMQLIWRVSERGGMIQRLHYLEIEKLADDACILSSGEDWYGRLAPFVGRTRRRAVRAGLAAMNEALSARAVARWRGQGATPTSKP